MCTQDSEGAPSTGNHNNTIFVEQRCAAKSARRRSRHLRGDSLVFLLIQLANGFEFLLCSAVVSSGLIQPGETVMSVGLGRIHFHRSAKGLLGILIFPL